MTQRNNFDTAELPPRAGSLGLSSTGQDTLANDNSRLAARGRRASRIPISLPVTLRDQFGGQHQARTQSVMVRGAVVTSAANLRVGHKLTMQNLKSGKSAECHVTSIEPGIATSNTVELEFTGAQPDFWPVQFPSENSATQATTATPPLTSADQLSLADDISGPPKVSSKIPTPAVRPREAELVSLADSVEHNFAAPAIAAKPVIPRTPPPTDSVAQFRAANRAAHRRQQRTKTLYSVACVLALAALAFAGKNWLSHRPAATTQPEAFAPEPAKPVKTMAAKSRPSSSTSPSTAVANVFAALKSTQSKVMERIKLPVTAKTTLAPDLPAEAATAPADTSTPVDATPVAQAQPADDSQVTVRHGASLASQRVQDNGEEPVALPLTASIPAASQPKPEALSEVVAQTPTPPKPVGLAPQVPKQLTSARLIASAPAQYPPMARQLHQEGEVVLNVDIDISGKVSDAKVISGPPVLRSAALDSVRRWTYQPATLGDKPVPSTQTVKVDFRLK